MKLPVKFLDRMQSLLGDEFDAFQKAIELPVPVSVRINPKKNTTPFEGSSNIPWCDKAYFLKERPAFVFDPYFHCGSYYVQESSSIVLDHLIRSSVDLNQPIAALDLCASPGGKSTLTASLLNDDSFLLSNELVGSRARVLEENLIRWGQTNTYVSNNHSRDFKALKSFFDLIVLDAPCSGEGMFRKHQLSIDQWSNNKIDSLATIQAELLEEMAALLKPNGVIIYSTCTHSLEENENNVAAFLNNNEEFELVNIPVPEEWGFSNQIAKEHFPELPHQYRAFFHKAKGEGFFFSVLRKKEDSSMGKYKKPKKTNTPLKPLDQKFIKEVSKYIEQPENYEYRTKVMDVYAIPKSSFKQMEILNAHLRLIKPGLLIGQTKGKNFVPSIDLALSEAVNKELLTIKVNKDDAIKYYKGLNPEIEFSGEQGWYIIQFDGNNLGWAKVLKNRINNHLPKSWKIRKSIDDALEGE